MLLTSSEVYDAKKKKGFDFYTEEFQ